MKLSVIIPVWHGLEPQNISALLKQTRRPDEVCVVFDGVDPVAVPKWWKTRLIEHSGAAKARNIGLSMSSGELVLFLDDDTTLRPDCLQHMEYAIVRHKADFAYCDYERTGELTGVQRGRKFSVMNFVDQNGADCCSLVRREMLPRPPFDPAVKRLMDWDLWLNIIRRGGTGKHIPMTLYTKHYRKGDISLSGDYEQWKQFVVGRGWSQSLPVPEKIPT